MASVAESSVASVPLSHLLQLQNRLLQEPSAVNAQQPKATDEMYTSAVQISVPNDVETIPESADVYNTPKSPPKAPARLPSSKSAPAAQMEAMIQPSPSQEAFATLTCASSFHAYPEGDTQPMESQVYRDYRESMVQPSVTTPKKTVLKAQISPDGKTTYDEVGTEKTPKTCVEGETGFIDLETAWQQSSPTALSTSSNLNEFLDVQTQQPAFNNLTKQSLPETPAIAGNKHGRNSELLTSPTTNKKTPGFSQIFGGLKGQVMSATQLFNQTQAPSSPLLDAPRSDPIMSRPSPTLEHQYSVSSPTVMMTSPVANAHSRPGTAGEPRERYTSMRESQERRAARLRQELGLHCRADEEIFEEDEEEHDQERTRFEHKRRQKVMSDQAFQEWAKVGAPSRHGSRPSSRLNSSLKPSTIDLVTPAAEKHRRIEFDISDGGDSLDADAEAEDEQLDKTRQSDDEYDELGQTVLRSQGNGECDQDKDDRQILNRPADSMGNVIQYDCNSSDIQAEQNNDSKQHKEDHLNGTQHSAIADSQLGRSEIERSLLPPQILQPPSMSSFVPGSQYPGKTSQNQERGLTATATRFDHPAPSAAGMVGSHQVPSSPPLPTAAACLANEGVEAAALYASTTTKLQNVENTKIMTANEIPESDLTAPGNERSSSLSLAATENGLDDESHNILPFSAAPTHMSESGVSQQKTGIAPVPLKGFSSQPSAAGSQSPRKAAGLRHFADIAVMATPPKIHAETSFDIDEIISDVITADDHNFMEAVSSPPRNGLRKRRKLEHNACTGISSPAKNLTSSRPHQPVIGEQDFREQDMVQDTATNQKPASVNALRDSPSKANEQPLSIPSNGQQQNLTPDSVKKPEEAGAKAASQLLSKRAPKSTKSAKLSTYSRKGGTRVMSRESTVSDAAKTRLKLKIASETKAHTAVGVSQAAIDTVHSFQLSNGLNRNVREDTRIEQESNGQTATPTDLLNKINPVQIHAANRVFALCKGSFNNFYPANWLGHSADENTCEIVFDDGTPASILLKHVRRLELRVGDTVKVDVPGMRNKTWLIEGFADVAFNAGETARSDIHGQTNVRVRCKSTRDSCATDKVDASGVGNVAEVAVSAIYLTRTMWPHFADRIFHPPPTPKITMSRPVTPFSKAHNPEFDISMSRKGLTILPTANAKAFRTSSTGDESVALAEPARTGIFFGMAFAISYASNEIEKADVTRMILRNGGAILENGFDELFGLPSIGDSEPTRSTKKSPRQDKDSVSEVKALQLKSEYEGLGFVALIADKHSRKAKYVQALALGLPTISGRWIIESLNLTKNPSTSSTNATPLPWAKYLLSAGESTYLGGAVRSRTINVYDAAQAKLSNVIEGRDILLRGDGVLIVVPKKGKSGWDRRKAYAFLTLALGAGCVKRVYDLAEAKAFISAEPEKWKWIYVNGSVAEASAAMFGKANGTRKKRKRGEEIVKVDPKAMSAGDGKVKIVNDEFVVQSLILGSLVD